MYGSFEVQKIRRDRPRDEDSRRQDPKRDKRKKHDYSFQRNQKRGEQKDTYGDSDRD